jgi:hypothetical protein
MLQNSQISGLSTTYFFGSHTLPGINHNGKCIPSFRYCKTFNDLFFQLSQLQVNLLSLLTKHLIPSCFYQCWVQCSSSQQLLLFFLPTPAQIENVGKKMFCFQCNFEKFKFIFEKIRQIFSIKNLKTKTGCVGI